MYHSSSAPAGAAQLLQHLRPAAGYYVSPAIKAERLLWRVAACYTWWTTPVSWRLGDPRRQLVRKSHSTRPGIARPFRAMQAGRALRGGHGGLRHGMVAARGSVCRELWRIPAAQPRRGLAAVPTIEKVVAFETVRPPSSWPLAVR